MADGNDIRIVTLGTIALFSDYKLTTSSGKNLEDKSHAHIVSLKYNSYLALKIVMICLLHLIEIVEGGNQS